MRRIRVHINFLLMLCLFVGMIVPVHAVGTSPGFATLVDRMNTLHAALTPDERDDIRNARDIVQGLDVADASIISEIWTEIQAKVAANPTAPSGLITQDNLMQLLQSFGLIYYPDGRGIAALPSTVKATLDQLAGVAGVSLPSPGYTWDDVSDFMLELESALTGAVPSDYTALIALGSDQDALINLLEGAVNDVLNRSDRSKLADLIKAFGIKAADHVKPVVLKMTNKVDPTRAASKALLMSYIRTNATLNAPIQTDANGTKHFSTLTFFNIQNVPVSIFDWSSSNPNVQAQYDNNAGALKVSLLNGATSETAEITATLTSFPTNPLHGRMFFKGTVQLTATTPTPTPTSTPDPGPGPGPGPGPITPTPTPGAGTTPSEKDVTATINDVVDALKGLVNNPGTGSQAENAKRADKALEDAITKVATVDLNKDVTVVGNTASITLDAKSLANTFKNIKTNIDKVIDAAANVNPNATASEVIAKISLGTVNADNQQVTIPKDIATEAKANGITKLAIEVNGITMVVDLDDIGNSDITMDIKAQSQSTAPPVNASTSQSVASDVFSIEFTNSDGTPATFEQPVGVNLPIKDATGKDTELFVLAKVVDGHFEYFGGTYDPETKTFSAQRNSFSTYVVIENKVSFQDTASIAWANRPIQVVASKGIIDGRAEGIYEPNESVTRAEFAKLIVKAFGLENNKATEAFNDVGDSDWFKPYVAAAVKAGIVNGRSESTFDPQATITRAEMSTMAARALVAAKGYSYVKNASAELAKFADASSIHSTLSAGVALAASLGVVEGMDNSMFNPNENSTRAQAAVIIYRMLNK